MNYPDMTRAQFDHLQEFSADGPVFMLNLLRFKSETDSGLTGEAQYRAYLKQATPFIEASGAQVIFYGRPLMTLIGPEAAEWHKVLIVRYESISDFRAMIQKPDYPAHVRRAALEDSRLICCQA